MLSKDVSSTIFWVFGMTRLGTEPQSPGPLESTLHTRLMGQMHANKWLLTNKKMQLKNMKWNIEYRVMITRKNLLMNQILAFKFLYVVEMQLNK